MSGLIRRQKPPVQSSQPAQLPERLVPLKEAAWRLGMAACTVRQRKNGTAHFKLIRQGTGQRRRIYLLESELEAHLQQLAVAAPDPVARTLRWSGTGTNER